MKVVFLLLIWLEPFVCGIRLVPTETSSLPLHNPKINFWKRLETQPFFSRIKRSNAKAPNFLPALPGKKSNKDSVHNNYNWSSRRKKPTVLDVSPTRNPTVKMRKRRSDLVGPFDPNKYYDKKVHDPYYVFGSVQSALFPRISRKAATDHYSYDENFTTDTTSNYELSPELVTPILFLDDIAISPILLNENSKFWPNHKISKSDKSTKSVKSKNNIKAAVQEKPYQYVFGGHSNDLTTLETMNPEIRFPSLANDPMIPMYSMNYAGSNVIVPEENTLNFQRKNIATGKLSETAVASLDDLLPVPFHLITWPYSLEDPNFRSTKTPNGKTNTIPPLLKSLKIPQILKLENQLSEDSNSLQSSDMQNLPLAATKPVQSIEELTTRGTSEAYSETQKTHQSKDNFSYLEAFNVEPYLTTPVDKMLNNFNPTHKDQMASNSNINLNSTINLRKIPDFLQNITEKKKPNAWIIVLQKRNENKLEFYQKILSLLNSINKKLEISNTTTSTAHNSQLPSQHEVTTEQPSKDYNLVKNNSQYSAPLREFILNQIFLLSESLETLKKFDEKGATTKVIESKFNVDGQLSKSNLDKLDKKKKKLDLASRDAENGWSKSHQNPNGRKKRNIANRTHFEAVDNILSFRMLEHALEREDDESLLYLLKELLVETKGSLQSVARQYEFPILNLPLEIPNPITKLDSAHISKLRDKMDLLKKIHLLDHLNIMKEFEISQKEMMKPTPPKITSTSQLLSRERRASDNNNLTDVKENMEEKSAKDGFGPIFTLPLITPDETKSMSINASDFLPLTSSLNDSTTITPKLRRLNLAYGKPLNKQNNSNEEKLEKRMLTMERDDHFHNNLFHGSINNLPELFTNSFVTQNRTRAEMEFNKRMLSVSNATDILDRNSTSPLNVFYEDADILISEVPQHFLTDGNTTIQNLKSLLDGNGSFVSEVYIVKDDGCRTLKIVQDKYLEENCNFNNIESGSLNNTPFSNSDIKQNAHNTGLKEAKQMMNPQNNDVNIKTSEMQQMDYNSPEKIANSGLPDKFPGAYNQFYDHYSPNSPVLNTDLQEFFSRIPEADLKNSELIEHHLLNTGFSDDILNAYYFNPNNFADLSGNSFVSDTSLETDKMNLENSNFNSLTETPSVSASKLTNTMMNIFKEDTRSPTMLDASPPNSDDINMNKDNLLGSHSAPNVTKLEMASSEVSQRKGKKVTDNAGVLPSDLINILKLISNGDSSENDKDKELAYSLNSGIDILSNVESLLSRLGQGKVTVNTETSLNPLSTRSAKTLATSAENEFLRNISANPLFNGIRVDSEKQINIELTLDNNENIKKKDAEIEATTLRPIKESSVLEKLLNLRNADLGKSSKSQEKTSTEDKLFVLPASFLKQLEGFDYSEFESIVSYNFTKNNASKSTNNKNSDKYFLEKLLENKEKLLYLLSNLNKDNNITKDDHLDTEEISHLKNLIKDKAEPVLDSIIATFFKPLLRPKPKTSESLTDKNITEISDVNFNSSLSPGNLEIFILRYDGGGGGVQTLLKEYKDFAKELLGTRGRKLAAQVGNNTDIKELNKTTSQESNHTGVHDKVFVGTTTLNNGTNIKVTITINSNENKPSNSSEGGSGYHKEILVYGKDKPSKNRVRYKEEDYDGPGSNDPTDAYSGQNDLYNPILAANKPTNLRSNQNFGFIRLPRKTVVTTESTGKLKNSDFSLSLTNRKFSSRMQQLVPTEDYISQLMPPLPTRKLIPHYQFPIILPLESTVTKKPKWVWMKSSDANSASSDSISKQTEFDSSSINSAAERVPISEEIPTIALEAPTLNFFGEISNLDELEGVSEMEESASNDVDWLW